MDETSGLRDYSVAIWVGVLLFTHRGAGGYWRTYQAQQLATPESFKADPSLVWEFYSYRREVMHSKVCVCVCGECVCVCVCNDLFSLCVLCVS